MYLFYTVAVEDWIGIKEYSKNSVSHLIFSFLPMLTTIQIIVKKKNSAFFEDQFVLSQLYLFQKICFQIVEIQKRGIICQQYFN